MPRSQIPILTFHALEEEEATTPISFSPALFARAIKKWHDEGWRTISLAEGVRHVQERTAFPAKSFVLTFDDGYASVYRHAFPLLEQFGMTATIFVAPNGDGRTGGLGGLGGLGGETPLPTLFGREMLCWNEIREMRRHGIDFGAHSLTHRDLTRLTEKEIDSELSGSQQIIAEALGEPVTLLAYPFGKYDARVREIAGRYYEGACGAGLGLANMTSDVLALERVETYYLRETWAADGMTKSWFPLYLWGRNVPRSLRRILMK